MGKNGLLGFCECKGCGNRMNNFCSACKGSREENGVLICVDKNGVFYKLAVKNVLMAPCMKPKAN